MFKGSAKGMTPQRDKHIWHWGGGMVVADGLRVTHTYCDTELCADIHLLTHVADETPLAAINKSDRQ